MAPIIIAGIFVPNTKPKMTNKMWKIAVLEDDPDMQAYLAYVVEQAEGFEFLFGETHVSEALKHLENDPLPDLCLVDLQLPDGNCLLYTSPSPRDQRGTRMPSSA